MGSLIGGIVQAGATMDAAQTEANAAEYAANVAQTGYNYLTTGAGAGPMTNYINAGQTALVNQQGVQSAISGLLDVNGTTPNTINWATANPAQAQNYINAGYTPPGRQALIAQQNLAAAQQQQAAAPQVTGSTFASVPTPQSTGQPALSGGGQVGGGLPANAGQQPAVQSGGRGNTPAYDITAPWQLETGMGTGGGGSSGGTISTSAAPAPMGSGSASNSNAAMYPSPNTTTSGVSAPPGGTTSTQGANPASGFQNYLNSTGYQFQLGQGTGALMANAGSVGLLDSGANAKALTQYGQNLSATTFNNYLSQLSGMNSIYGGTAQAGQNALGQIATAGTASGGAAANAIIQGATAQGNAIAGLGGSLGNMFSQLGNQNLGISQSGSIGSLFGSPGSSSSLGGIF